MTTAKQTKYDNSSIIKSDIRRANKGRYYSFAKGDYIPFNTQVYEPVDKEDMPKRKNESLKPKIQLGEEVLQCTNFKTNKRHKLLLQLGYLVMVTEYLESDGELCNITEMQSKRFRKAKLTPRRREDFKQDELLELDVDKNQKKEYGRNRPTSS